MAGGSESPESLERADALVSPIATVPVSSFNLHPSSLLGLAILIANLEVGELIKRAFGLILPGSILGLFLLLALLSARIVPLRWVEGAARMLLWLLPFLFMPIFILALKNRGFWVADSGAFVGVVVLATFLLWAATGHFAQRILRRE